MPRVLTNIETSAQAAEALKPIAGRIRLVDLHPWDHRNRASSNPTSLARGLACTSHGVIGPVSIYRCGHPLRHAAAPHLDLFRIGGALATPQSAIGVVHDTNCRQFLRDVQTDIAGHRIASDAEATTGLQRAVEAWHYPQVSQQPP
jgi:hypothetical protein